MESKHSKERNIPRVVSPGDKRKLNQVLWQLKNENIFKSFEEIKNGIQTDNKIGFSFVLHSARKVNFYFFTRNNGHITSSSTVEVALENASGGQYLLEQNFLKDELFKKLKTYIFEHNVGTAMEHDLIRNLSEYLLDDKVPHFGIEYVRCATDQEDVSGVDMYFGFKQGEFPLQLKKGAPAQVEHKKKFPKIPSYVFNPELTVQESLKKFSKMAERYFKGEIQHLLDNGSMNYYLEVAFLLL
jgi:hypothetical protein